MEWHDRLTPTLLDFLFELEKKGLTTPLTIAGGFGLFLKRRYLNERMERTLFDNINGQRTTEDIDIFIPIDILCNRQESQVIVDTLQRNYEVIDTFKFTQWKKIIEFEEYTGYVKLDFLTGNVDACKVYVHIKGQRARNRRVGGFHARITPEALCIDENAQTIPLLGRQSNGEECKAVVRIPHPFTYLMMKLFAFRDRQDDINKGQYHAFDIFSIIGTLTEWELKEAVELGKKHVHVPVFQEAKQIVESLFTGTRSSGMIAIKAHPDFKAEYYDDFWETLTEIFGVAH